MELEITLLILFSAVIHSIWNIQLKKSNDPITYVIAIAIVGWVIFTPYAIYRFFNSSISAETFLFTFSSFLIHFLYFLFLGRAYEKFELSVVYPIARGLSVFLIPIYGILILNEDMTFQAIGGCCFIILGIIMTGSISIGDVTNRDKRKLFLKSGAFSAILIGIIISLYSLVDKKAASGIDPVLFVWITDMSAVILGMRYLRNSNFKNHFTRGNIRLIIPGVFQFSSYVIVIYAYSSTMLSYAGTFREIGTVFGAIFAKIFLKEEFGRKKTLGILLIVAGAFLISIF
ncbi:MAG: EamA family transporter [Chloroflexota bacterium]|nr:EamA family transporter [Chloroflexota bacterium]